MAFASSSRLGMQASTSCLSAATIRHVNTTSGRPTLPAILNLPQTLAGNRKPKSLHKTRRFWRPNVHRVDQPVRVIEAVEGRRGLDVLKGVKMTMRHLRTFEKMGGVEGALLSGSPNDLTTFGKQLRAELFQRLTEMRDGQGREDETSAPSGTRT